MIWAQLTGMQGGWVNVSGDHLARLKGWLGGCVCRVSQVRALGGWVGEGKGGEQCSGSWCSFVLSLSPCPVQRGHTEA